MGQAELVRVRCDGNKQVYEFHSTRFRALTESLPVNQLGLLNLDAANINLEKIVVCWRIGTFGSRLGEENMDSKAYKDQSIDSEHSLALETGPAVASLARHSLALFLAL